MAVGKNVVKTNLSHFTRHPQPSSESRAVAAILLASSDARPYLISTDQWPPRPKTTETKMATGTNRIFDEFARLMTDAAGTAQGMKKEVETAFQAQAERFLNSMEVVKREEFEVVRDMAIKARDENDALKARIDALEAKLADKTV